MNTKPATAIRDYARYVARDPDDRVQLLAVADAVEQLDALLHEQHARLAWYYERDLDAAVVEVAAMIKRRLAPAASGLTALTEPALLDLARHIVTAIEKFGRPPAIAPKRPGDPSMAPPPDAWYAVVGRADDAKGGGR